ncbi:MAG: NUDIX domain-containing protein [Vicinamibacterales bacterium]
MAEFRFCPVCGQPLEPRVLKLGEPMRLVCTSALCGFVFYLDPKVAVGTIIGMPDGRIVLVKRAIEPGFGLWVFPGGYVDRGEDVRLAAVREAREEAGIDVGLGDLVGIYSYPGTTPVVIVYRATWLRGELAVDDENSEIRTFAAADLPWAELAFRSTREALRDYLGAGVA